jgi:hypothetical protein
MKQTRVTKKKTKAKQLSIVIERLEKQVGDASSAFATCVRIYCLPPI